MSYYHRKTVLVTGASQGIGKAVAQELAGGGARTLLVARRAELLEDVAGQIRRAGRQATAIACDLTEDKVVQKLVSQVKAQFGQIHLLVNNAGQLLFMPLQASKLDSIHNIFEINCIAPINLIRRCLELLKPGSSIVNVSSATAIQGASSLSVYAATKAALAGLTRSLARELASRQVRVNAVAPGMVVTDMLNRILGKLTPEQRAVLEARHPLGFGTVEDVAAAVAFLGSDQAKWITGHTLVVDGGLTA